MKTDKKAVVILSGGLDSTTCMGIAREQGYELHPVTFDYGQRHTVELERSRQVASFYDAADRHHIIPVHFLKSFGGSALTDESIDVPMAAADESADEIPATYVPGRNLLFLSIASSYAETIDAEAIYIGVNALDYSGYPDCRPAFIEKMQEVIAVGTKAGAEGKTVKIQAPLIHLGKEEIIRWGVRLHVPYHITTSCYNGGLKACGQCDSCRLRLKGFAEAGISDPIPYV